MWEPGYSPPEKQANFEAVWREGGTAKKKRNGKEKEGGKKSRKGKEEGKENRELLSSGQWSP